jgi:hypothetical protein
VARSLAHFLLRRPRFNGCGLKCPPNGTHANAVLPGKLRDGCALTVTVGNHPLLTVIEPLRTSELLALPLGTLDPRIGAAADQATLKLGNAAHDGEHQPAGVGRGVAPAFAKRYEAAGKAIQFVHDVVQVAARL